MLRTIAQPSHIKIIVQKSSFFGYAIPLSCEQDVKQHIEKIAKKHKKANHVAYAYRIASRNKLGEIVFQTRACDAGEPTKTAGYPLLRLLEQQQLTNTLLVVARVFGGVKLGVAGLSKAYQLAGIAALDENTVINV